MSPESNVCYVTHRGQRRIMGSLQRTSRARGAHGGPGPSRHRGRGHERDGSASHAESLILASKTSLEMSIEELVHLG